MSPTRARIPSLPRGVRVRWDAVRKTHVLLGPERALMLDQIAHEILKRTDGAASISEISADLADAFGAPFDQVAGDVDTFFTDLVEKRLVDVR